MAKKKKQTNTSVDTTKTFFKGLTRDSDASFIKEGMWVYARNAVNNTREGDLGTLSNEESNALCGIIGSDITSISVEVVVIGAIPLYSGKWAVYSVIYNKSTSQKVTSEIGLFEEDTCNYRPIVRDACLDFDKFNLVSGSSREKEDCTWQVYWADGNNPDRLLNIGDPKLWPSDDYTWLGGLDGTSNINYYSNGVNTTFLWPGVSWNENCDLVDECYICYNLQTLNCDEIRLAKLVKTPCINVKKSSQPGILRNGSYAFGIAYTINDQVVTNYFSLSAVQPIWNETDEKGAIELELDLDTENFDQFLLVSARNLSETPSLKDVGYYSTKTKKIVLDKLDESLRGNSELIVFGQNPVYETSEQITSVNKYLLKIGPIGKFDFNYQPLANLIRSKWVSVEYPEKYYINGGNNTGYLRDEVYSFFIRWVYDTGDKSASYHIPGRASRDFLVDGVLYNEEDTYTNNDTLPGEEKLYETINTGVQTSGAIAGTIDENGGVIVAKGDMGYWQSSESYPDNNALRYNATSQCFTRLDNTPENQHEYDLCGKKIRHHKFPDNVINKHFRTDGTGISYIRLMGVEFENIILPKDNQGNDISGIVGYEILRGSREGNRSIAAKGIVNNFRDFKLQGGTAQDNMTALYANYPFNCIRPLTNDDDFGDDDYAYNDPYIFSQPPDENPVGQNLPQDLVSFHSPDTSFYNPFLSMTELKVYGHLQGTAEQSFIEPNGHPEFKLLANSVVLITLIGGLLNAILKAQGEVHINYPGGTFTNNRFQVLPVGGQGAGVPPLPPVTVTAGTPVSEKAARTAAVIANTTRATAQAGYFAIGGPLLESFPFLGNLPNGGLSTIYGVSRAASNAGPGSQIDNPTLVKQVTPQDGLPAFIDAAAPIGLFLFNLLDGAETTANLLYQIAPYKQYALEQISYGEYTSFVNPLDQNVHPNRFVMADGIYVYNANQNFPEFQNVFNNSIRYKINNKNRPKLVTVRTEDGSGQNIGPRFIYPGSDVLLTPGIPSTDQSLMTLGNAKDVYESIGVNFSETGKLVSFSNTIASNYVGLKFNIRNQYRELDSIAQLIATPCEQKIDFTSLTSMEYGVNSDCEIDLTQNIINKTDVFFGGDTYINRFTEKNIMPFFKNWLYNQVDGTRFNYYLVPAVPYPRFWVNSNPWAFGELLDVENILDAITGNNFGSGLLPNSYFELDGGGLNFISPKNDYFYLSNNGIRDFFVESEVLVDFRDKGPFEKDEFYSKYRFTDLEALFNMNPDIITAGNSYIYDYSYSISKFTFTAYASRGVIQTDTYDPTVADICLTSLPNRINYSLPQQEEETTDGWLTFLNFNRVAFKDNVNFVKKYGKTGMFITFENSSPLVYQGVDERENYIGVKATIGDGGLFSATPITLTASDDKYEFGSSQDRLAVVSTPVGMYYISQQQGRIFTLQQGALQEISSINMKWWFNEFLPYKLIEDFPNFPHVDNPVAGIGCSAGFNSADSILYFSKKDYILRPKYKGLVTYAQGDIFIYAPLDNPKNKLKVKLGDPIFFEDASWTISYDPKNKQWISFHDWHPNLYLSGRDKHYTTKAGGIWEHNAGCNDYCNFYTKQFPFEIGIPMSTGQSVTTLRSFEYILECYRRDNLYCVDQYHVLDYNFDEAIIFNSEQVSGHLNLNIFPKNNIALAQDYPKVNINSIDILVSKEENKYRFNQFWDITNNRGEFPNGSGYPPTGPLIPGTTRLLGNYTQEQIWNTQANGYIQTLNPLNLNYNKSQLQRKKFRHYNNFVKLGKVNSRSTNMIMKVFNSKNQISIR